MSQLADDVRALHQMIIDHDTLDALERFYGDDVVMQDNHDRPRVGKAENIEHEKRTLARMKMVHAEVRSTAIDEEQGHVFAEWLIVFADAKGNHFAVEEVSVQRWRDHKIEHERFYYQKARPVTPETFEPL